jgi:hypothetical protein
MDFPDDPREGVRARAEEKMILLAREFVLQCNMFFNFLFGSKTKGKIDITKIERIVQPTNEQKNIREAHENGRAG